MIPGWIDYTVVVIWLAIVVAPSIAHSRPITCDPIADYHSATYTRNTTATREFRRLTGFPDGRPGFQIDHMRPLFCGGGDCPANLQWLRIEEKKLKDRWELDCTRYVPVG